MNPFAGAAYGESALRMRGEKQLLVKSAVINLFIVGLVAAASFSELVAFAGGLLLIVYYVGCGLIRPKSTFFLILGTKLTFDALWVVKAVPLPLVGPMRMLELFFLPVLAISLFGTRVESKNIIYLWLSMIYLIHTALAAALNLDMIDITLLVRQSGFFLGLLLSYKYLKTVEDLNLANKLILISTVIPVLASIAQFLLGYGGYTILHYTTDPVRGSRGAGIYYDSATNGMSAIISLLCNTYLLHQGIALKRYRILHIISLPMCLLIALIGGTRSIIIVTMFILTLYLMGKLKTALRAAPFIIAVMMIAKPYTDRVLIRSAQEFRRGFDIRQMLQETDYRGAFTGRMGTWQDIWSEFSGKTDLQKLFGTGLSSNAHSSYFFLLLQIGWLGLLLYLGINAMLIMQLFQSRAPPILRLIAILSLSALMLIGISATTVIYTSFQWIVYFLVGSVISIGSQPRQPARAA